MGDLDLAAFCVKHAAELEEGLGQSPTQKAIVQSFLKNYDKVIWARVLHRKPLYSPSSKTMTR